MQTKWGRMDAEAPALRRRITAFDFTLITVGSIIGSGIFRNPAVVAQRAHTPFLTMLAWVLGGVLALIGAFVFAELAARRPQDGGLYAYLKDAFGPGMGFVFVWMDFSLMYTGGTAASAALFAGYVAPAFGITLSGKLVAVIAVACVTLINVLGVRQGATWQNLLVILKVGAIAGLIAAGFVAHPVAAHAALPGFANGAVLAGALGVALLPALFAYQGFHSAAYVTSETIDAARTIPRGLLLGMGIVVAAYLLVNAGCLRVLGAAGLAATATPAADIMTAAVGPWGGRIIAVAIALSTLGYMSTSILVAPRVYYALAQDGMCFPQIGWVHPRTRVPVVAIVLHGTVAAALAATGTFAQIINWTTLPVWTFIALAAVALFIFRARDGKSSPAAVRVPGHPWSTILLMAAVAGVLIAELAIYPLDALYAIVVALAGVALYACFVRPRLRA